jgi:hypothetical protein
MAEQAAEKIPKYGHSEEVKTTKNLQVADSYEKQVLRCAQDDRTIFPQPVKPCPDGTQKVKMLPFSTMC